MATCLDTEGCGFSNRENARFCTHCGIPLQGTLLQGCYEIQALIGKDRSTVTLHAFDRRQSSPVTVRALLPNKTSEEERENFLQDAELAVSLSARFIEAGSIRVTDYGQDGPLAFLIQSAAEGFRPDTQSSRPREAPHAGSNAASTAELGQGEANSMAGEKAWTKTDGVLLSASRKAPQALLPANTSFS